MKILDRALLLGVLIAAFCAFPTGAAAAEYCINADLECASTPENIYPGTQQGLADALAAAHANPGSDTVVMGPGTIAITSPLTAQTGADNELFIEGVGKGGSGAVLDFTHASGTGLAFQATSAPNSAIRAVGVKISGSTTGSRAAVSVFGGKMTDVQVEVVGGGHRTVGVEMWGFASCEYCHFSVAGPDAVGLQAGGSTSVTASSFSGMDASLSTIGLHQTAGSLTLSRSQLSQFGRTIVVDGSAAIAAVRDTLIELGNVLGAIGVEAAQAGAGVGQITASLDGVTIFGSGFLQVGVNAVANTSVLIGEQVYMTITNTLLMLTDSIRCSTSIAPSSVSISLSYSMVGSFVPAGNCTVTPSNNIDAALHTADEVFVNAWAGDLRPRPGSPVIDQGNPATVPNDRSFDAINGYRFAPVPGGRIDIGAIEYQPYAPDQPEITASATMVLLGTPIEFTAQSSDGNGDALTYHWDFGDGNESSDQNPTHTFAAAGSYDVEVWAYDPVLGSIPATITITVLAPPVDPPVVPPLPPTDQPALPLPASVVFGKFSKKISFKKRAKLAKGFNNSSKRPKGAALRVIASERVRGTLRLLSRKGKALKGSQKITLRAGTSYLSFRGKWGGKRLKRGKYTLRFTSSALKDAKKATLNVVR